MSVEKSESQFVNFLLSWFQDNKRDFPWRHEEDPYRILVAEKMLQQTTYGHVMNIYSNFIIQYPSANSLSKADEKEIEALIKPLGFHRQRSRQFSELSKTIVCEHFGKVPNDKESLLKLSGVGEYIANAVLCFAFQKDVPIVDINVRRVLGRVFSWRLKDKEIYERLSKLIQPGTFKNFNWGIIDFSSLICSRKPKCRKCGATSFCNNYKDKCQYLSEGF
ncbi:hypothetical protein ACFL0D_06560 [Thermoproteota archaeon]